MKSGKVQTIRSKALEILSNYPDGVRFMELVRKTTDALPNQEDSTVWTVVSNLYKEIPNDVYKVSRGLYRLTRFKAAAAPVAQKNNVDKSSKTAFLKEEDLYKPFSNYLEEELEECTHAFPLGQNKFRDYWGTPDVIGVYESRRSDVFKTEPTVVAAEIKLGTTRQELITAFGQACSYRVFSHKVYLVLPKKADPDELSRVESLCQIFGIGLVFYSSNDSRSPDFEIRVRASKGEPDIFYVNKYLRLVEDELFGHTVRST